jgi:hypothetical protein
MISLLSYLREAGVIPAAKPPQTLLGSLLGECRMWLVQERGLAAATVTRPAGEVTVAGLAGGAFPFRSARCPLTARSRSPTGAAPSS